LRKGTKCQMSDVVFIKGYGDYQYKDFYHSQAVKIGNRVETAGQGGWSEAFAFPATLHAEILQAFENVGRVLQAAGTSWTDVVAIRSYHVGLNEEIDAFMIE